MLVGRVSGALGRLVFRTADVLPKSQGHSVPALANVWMQGQGQRFYKKKNSVKVPPTKPIYLGHSGDRTTELDDIDLTQSTPKFENVKELENVPEEVKKLVSLEFADGDVILEKRVLDIRREVQEHPADVASLEVTIAWKTIKLRNSMRHTLEFRKDKMNKSRLFREIANRNKLLKLLRDVDYEKFLWICEKLDIVYTPPNPYKDFPLGRRAMRKKVARDQMFEMQKEKLAELEKKLETEKVVFLTQKEEEMKALKAEMKDLGVEDFSDLQTILKQLLRDEYKPPVRQTKSRRELILAKKFELYGKLKKEQTPT